MKYAMTSPCPESSLGARSRQSPALTLIRANDFTDPLPKLVKLNTLISLKSDPRVCTYWPFAIRYIEPIVWHSLQQSANI